METLEIDKTTFNIYYEEDNSVNLQDLIDEYLITLYKKNAWYYGKMLYNESVLF